MNKQKKIGLYILAALFVLAGINHFVNPLFYKKIMPPWLSLPYTLIYISGACEIVFGLLLMPKQTRRVAAWCIIALLVAVFPANIQMMLNYREEHNPYLWIAILRLPLQLLLIWWAYLFTSK